MSDVHAHRVRGDLVLHPVALASLAVLLLNDHVLKAAAPGWVTGKLSDVAGLAFLPFLLVAVADLVRRVARRDAPGVRTAAVSAVVTAVGFAAVKLADPVRETYVSVVGWVRYPLDAAVGGATGPRSVVVVADPSDIVAVLACVAVVAVVMRARSPRHPETALPSGPSTGPATGHARTR